VRKEEWLFVPTDKLEKLFDFIPSLYSDEEKAPCLSKIPKRMAVAESPTDGSATGAQYKYDYI
jgi:hypothetical protein